MVLQPLSACQDHVIVGHDNALGILVGEESLVDATNTGDHAVPRCVLHQILDGAASSLSCNGKRSVFNKRARIANVVDIFAHSAVFGFSSFGDCCLAILVQLVAMPCHGLCKVRANVVKVLFCGLLCFTFYALLLGNEQNRMIFHDGIANLGGYHCHLAGHWRLDHVLHFHCIHHGQFLARKHQITLAD